MGLGNPGSFGADSRRGAAHTSRPYHGQSVHRQTKTVASPCACHGPISGKMAWLKSKPLISLGCFWCRLVGRSAIGAATKPPDRRLAAPHFRADRADGWMYGGKGERSDEAPAPEHGATDMRLDDHFGSGPTLQRNERVKLAASFWNNAGAGMVIVGMAGAFFLDKPPGAWAKIGIAIGGLVLGWFCYSIASNILTYLHTLPEERR